MVESYAHNEEHVAWKWDDFPWASEKGRVSRVTMFKIQGSKFQPRRGMWSECTISLHTPCGIFSMYQPETLNLVEMSHLLRK